MGMKNFLKWGIFAAAANIALQLIIYAAGLSTQDTGRQLGWVGMAIGIAIMFFGIKEKKSEDPAGFTFGRGWVEGFLISLVAGLIVAVFTFIYLDMINPEMLDFARSQAEMGMKTMQKEDYDKAQKMMGWMFSPSSFAIMTIFTYAIGGAIISLIISPIVKSLGGSAPPPAENGQMVS
jgi:hypothetical protein